MGNGPVHHIVNPSVDETTKIRILFRGLNNAPAIYGGCGRVPGSLFFSLQFLTLYFVLVLNFCPITLDSLCDMILR